MSADDEFDDPRDGGIIASLYRALNRREGMAPRGKLRVLLPVGAMLAVFAAVLWYSYPRAEAQRELLTVPVIKADLSSTKTVPADPGGMDIPHRDSTVFQAIRETRRARDAAGGVENLLPEAEQPLPREQLFAGLKTDLQDAEPLAAVTESDKDSSGAEDLAVAPAVEEKAPPAAPAPLAAKAGDSAEAQGGAPVQDDVAAREAAAREKAAADKAEAEKAVAEKRAAEKKAAEKKAAEKSAADKAAASSPPPATATSGDYYVQLGSLRTPEDAKAAWASFQSGFPAQLGALDLRVQKAELGDRGTYYRVQGGPVAEGRARDICQAISREKPGSCLVVRR